MKQLALFACLLSVAGAARSQTQEEVGDLDSFNRDVVYLGAKQTVFVNMRSNCTGDPNCAVLNAQPALTTIRRDNVSTFTLPGRVSNSLLCATMTPFIGVELRNNTAVTQNSAGLATRAHFTIRNAVFDDPSLLNPATGLPFNGEHSLTIVTYVEALSMVANQRLARTIQTSRTCNGALISKQMLANSLGLTNAQATQFFRNPTTIEVGVSADASLATTMSYSLAVRLYGDRR
jgi:hypothetical protein